MKYIFGPVKSRRLGKSLGINFFLEKTCTFDCIYCQLGLTVNKITQAFKFKDAKTLLNELREAIKQNKQIDYITFAGLGEPTLISNLRDIIKRIKLITDIPVAVITNSSLLDKRKVRNALCEADLIIPSLDVSHADSFLKINRPESSIKFNRIIKGLKELRKFYKGKIWLEIMLMSQSDLSQESISRFKEIIQKVDPDEIHLVSPVRIKNKQIRNLTKKQMLTLCKTFGYNCKIF